MAVRVLHVIGKMDRGGAESIIMNLYRAIDREKVQFDFVECSSEDAAYDNEIKELGGRIYRCPRMSISSIMGFVSWWKHFFDEHASDYTVVHGHIGSSAAIYLNEAKKHGIHTIAHSHNTNNAHTLGQTLYNIAAYPTRYIGDSFFACSRQAGIDRYGRKVGEKSIVFNNAIDTEKYVFSEEKRSVIREELGISEDCFVIGHVGRFNEQKNHRFLIECFAETAKIIKDTKLLLVGDGDLRKDIEAQIRELGVENKVIMTGVRPDVENLLQAMDVFVFPSIYEGLGMVMIEAQANGLMCIASTAIQDEAIMDVRLVERLKLDEGAEQWARVVAKHRNVSRRDCRQTIIGKGFDIRTVAVWLQDYYLAHSNTH